MKNHQKNQKKMLLLSLPFAVLALTIFAICVTALPSQPQIVSISNETSNASGIGTARDGDKGGYITTITLNASQQNFAWKAYVGNVTGKLVLENTGQFSIFEWDMGLNAFGNVYISRNGSVTWGGINCSNKSVIESEDTRLKLNSSNSNSINKTFSTTVHKSFKVSGLSYQNSTCYSTSTYINDSAQAASESAKFQEVLLSDTKSNLVYMVMMEQNQQGFDNNDYDFQTIVAEDETLSTPTTYYFYVELTG